MPLNRYILRGRKPIPEPDILKWGRWFETAERHVARTKLGDAEISTVFLGLDHNHFDDGAPILFETMIFGGVHDQYQTRCSTWEQAEQMHMKARRLVAESFLKPVPMPKQGNE